MTLSISDVAAFAQVTVRTIRHYHHIGLMPEPERDSLDRRVYSGGDALRLARIRALVDAGFSLSEILEVMPLESGHAVDTAVFNTVKRRVEQRLAAEQEILQEQQRQLRSIDDPKDIGLPQCVSEVCNALEGAIDDEELRHDMQEFWHTMAAALPPRELELFAAMELSGLRDEHHKQTYDKLIRLWNDSVGDQELDALADEIIAVMQKFFLLPPAKNMFEGKPSPVLESMLEQLPAPIQQLRRRAEERLWEQQKQ